MMGQGGYRAWLVGMLDPGKCVLYGGGGGVIPSRPKYGLVYSFTHI